MPHPSDKRRFTGQNIEDSPTGPGVYRLYDGPKVSYVGSAKDISERLSKHNEDSRFRDITSFDFLKTKTTAEARSLEQRQIEKYNPPQNHT